MHRSGNLHRLEGHHEDALRELRQAIQADPSNHFFQRMLGDAYSAANQDAEAKATFESLIAAQPRYWAGYNSYAAFHYRRGRFDQAASLWEQLIQWTPDHAQALANLGAAYIALRRNTDAESVLRRSCALRPHRTCYLNLGMALQRQRRTQEAISAYTRALEFGTPTTTLLLNLADAHAYLGRRAEALGYFRNARTLAEAGLKVNLQDSAQRAMLAYCLGQIGDRRLAEVRDRTGAPAFSRQQGRPEVRRPDLRKHGPTRPGTGDPPWLASTTSGRARVCMGD